MEHEGQGYTLSLMPYSEEQSQSLYLAKRRHEVQGRPELVARINAMIEDEAPFAEIQAVANTGLTENVKPEKEPKTEVEVPPLTGKGSGLKQWQSFARQVSTIEPEVIEAMSRNDLITVLADRGVIEPPESLGFGKPVEKDDAED